MKIRRPIIFINEGYVPYLSITIKQAVKSGNEVVLLSDVSCKKCCENWVNIEELETPEYQVFKEKYVHLSSNPYWFEFYCIKRWFMAWQYMRKNNITESVICDTDVLLYENMSDYDYGECDAALRLTSRKKVGIWDAGAEEAFWTLDALEKFIYFVLDIYENRINILLKSWDEHIKNNPPGGISDMFLLGLWVEENNKKIKIINSACLNEGRELLDPCVTVGDGRTVDEFLVDTHLRIKKIKFKNGKPHFWCVAEKSWVKSLSIHMQGKSKKYVLSLSKMVNNRVIHMIAAMIYVHFFIYFDRRNTVRNLVKREKKVYVYGVGAETEKMWNLLKRYNVVFVDQKACKEETMFHGRKVYALNNVLNDVGNAKFIIFSKKYSMEMKDALRQAGILQKNIYIM